MTADTIHLFLNPTAGRGRAGRRQPRIIELLEQSGAQIECHASRSVGDIEKQVLQCVNEGARRVVVAGGDGSVHEAVNGLLRSDNIAALGVVPTGTGNDFDVLTARRPPEMEVNEENLAAGRRIYYRNCMYCHGDNLSGKGHFADALNPLPANFRDGGTISQLEEGYVYWRVATGGPGLPQGATPWNSSMPVWQDFLSEDEIWQVVAYIYSASGSTPRTWEEH